MLGRICIMLAAYHELLKKLYYARLARDLPTDNRPQNMINLPPCCINANGDLFILHDAYY